MKVTISSQPAKSFLSRFLLAAHSNTLATTGKMGGGGIITNMIISGRGQPMFHYIFHSLLQFLCHPVFFPCVGFPPLLL